jgi:mRNA interferase YafQ
MRQLVLTPKFQRAFRKFVKRNPDLQQRIEDSLQQTEARTYIPEKCCIRRQLQEEI